MLEDFEGLTALGDFLLRKRAQNGLSRSDGKPYGLKADYLRAIEGSEYLPVDSKLTAIAEFYHTTIDEIKSHLGVSRVARQKEIAAKRTPKCRKPKSGTICPTNGASFRAKS